jgi:membrane protein implicated in regulation of membrane protease activity
MRQIFLLASILLLGLSWAVAQDTTSPTSSGQSSQTSAGGDTTVQGCLSGSGGSYTLTDKHGMSYQLTGDTAKLSEHVGHEVKVTGTTSSADSSPSSGAASGTAGSTGSQQTLQVSSVKHVSKTCQASGGMSH